MAEVKTKELTGTKDKSEEPTLSGALASLASRTIYSGLVSHVAADIGSTFQACLYSGWHTQSASIDSPEHVAEEAAKQQIKDKIAPEQETPKVGLEKE